MTSPATPDILQQQFGWQTSGADFTDAELVYCPLAPRPPSIIHLAHAMGGIIMARQGAEVVFGLESSSLRLDLSTRIQEWFEQAKAPSPLFLALDSWNAHYEGPSRADGYPLGITSVTQDIVRQGGDASSAVHQKLVVSTANRPDELHQDISSATGRLDTPQLILPYLHHRIRSLRSSAAVTLGGADEQPFWNWWDDTYRSNAPQLGHLYFPKIQGIDDEPPLTNWDHPEDLVIGLEDAFSRSAEETFHDRSSYVRWMVEQAYLLPRQVFHGDTPPAWEDIAPRLAEPDSRQSVAQAISHTFLQLL